MNGRYTAAYARTHLNNNIRTAPASSGEKVALPTSHYAEATAGLELIYQEMDGDLDYRLPGLRDSVVRYLIEVLPVRCG